MNSIQSTGRKRKWIFEETLLKLTLLKLNTRMFSIPEFRDESDIGFQYSAVPKFSEELWKWHPRYLREQCP